MAILPVYQMFLRSKSFFPKKPAIIFEGLGGLGRVLTYQDLHNEVERVVHLILDHTDLASHPACRVSVCLPNSPDFVSVYLALLKLGMVSVLINPALPETRRNQIVYDTASKLLIDENWLKTFRKSCYLCEYEFSNCLKNAEPKADDTSVILFSSGTTGEQKGVELTYNNIFNNVFYTNSLTGMTPDDRIMCFVPLTHCFGLNFVMSACFYTGATLVLHEKFNLEQVLDSCVKNRATMFFAVPAVYNTCLKFGIEPFYFSSVRYFFYAADSLSPESCDRWEREYGRKIYTGWGLTETSPFVTSNHASIFRRGSVGRPIPGVEIQIVNENGKDLGKVKRFWGNYKNYCGEIRVRGHNVMKGYLNNPEETKKAIDKDGWFSTGDIGYIDSEGYLHMIDRKKDMINVGGEKVWPAMVEKRILACDAVCEVAVVGIPHETMGEVPKAFIIPKNKKVTKAQIHEFLSSKKILTKNEYPREIEFIDALPRNPSGKILKNELRKK